MKKVFLLVIGLLMLTGCATMTEHLSQLPDGGFDSFRYHRTTDAADAHIVALGGSVEDGMLRVEKVHITLNYPFVDISAELDGYRRVIVVSPEP